ncbi:hypothetical protein SAMN05421805_11786 [Saccharopolyspora antimicrobica]|uniref:Uncharacterized protein n=1 Tax=Saccharopolyspora antimicrobica TaxID=455193 RepID=A0A1I5I4K8_9PSEU|nr:hypothetical protein [Saccharopolyspora antimicrobica]RKT83053.1 hypothetical protein ATL45_1326 [Saccharopolyspora antimicrobica]SFO55249.1 hypothetical protein SAMN05421805_11786 [Saccharopolyspora antimicrobica]
MIQHHELLALAGQVPDGWLAIAREAHAAADETRLDGLFALLGDPKPQQHTFAPEPNGHEEADRAVLAAIQAEPGAQACWATTRGGTDRVYLVQSEGDLTAATTAGHRALAGLADSPRVEVFAPGDVLPGYHENALLAATLLWSAEPGPEVRVARTFDGATAAGPWFDPGHELVVDPAERRRLLDFLTAGEVVLTADVLMLDVFTGTRAVPAGLRSDGTWVWSDAAKYYLDRYQLAPDAELAGHALGGRPGGRLTPLARHRVRAALTPQEGPS